MPIEGIPIGQPFTARHVYFSKPWGLAPWVMYHANKVIIPPQETRIKSYDLTYDLIFLDILHSDIDNDTEN